MATITITCPPELKALRVPALNMVFSAGVYTISDPEVIRFLLRWPSKSVSVDPQQVVDLKILPAEEVAGYGYDIVIGKDKATGKDIMATPDPDVLTNYKAPEGTPDFPKMTLRELREWMDAPEHEVKYRQDWNKEDYVRACQSHVKSKKKEAKK